MVRSMWRFDSSKVAKGRDLPLASLFNTLNLLLFGCRLCLCNFSVCFEFSSKFLKKSGRCAKKKDGLPLTNAQAKKRRCFDGQFLLFVLIHKFQRP